MSKDDEAQLKFITEWNKKQQEKAARKENKKANIKMHYSRCKAYFKLGFTCLFACVREIFRKV